MAVENKEKLIEDIKILRELGESYPRIAEHLGITLRQAKYYGRYEEEKAWLKARGRALVSEYNRAQHERVKRKKMEKDIIERMDEKISAIGVVSKKIKLLEGIFKEDGCNCDNLAASREGLEELLKEYVAERDRLREEGRREITEYNQTIIEKINLYAEKGDEKWSEGLGTELTQKP